MNGMQALCLLGAAAAAESMPSSGMQSPPARKTRVLVDLVHAYENNPDDFNLNKVDYEYYNSYSVFRLFRHLDENGYEHVCMREGRLTDELLRGFDMLFINVMHAEKQSPPFSPAEAAAVHRWIEAGGGLMIIGEHTNAYHCAELINPLISPIGLTLEWTAALDTPAHCTEAPGWILVTHLDTAHPVNQGVDAIHIMSGATVRPHASTLLDRAGRPARTQGVAFLGPEGWADQAGDG
jgi:hypothetical protein